MKYTPSNYAQILYETGDVKKFLKLLENHWVLPWLPKILEHFQEIVRKEQKVISVKVMSAHPLAEALKKEIETLIRREEGRSTEIDYVIDTDILGGFRIVSDDMVIAGSLADRLTSLFV